jgi:RNA polymerase sigma-70 factor (ECF subfamily)
MSDDERDRRLVAGCLAGDERAFESLVEAYQKPLFNTALRLVGDYDEAGDIAQRAFIRAFGKLSSFDPERRFFSWIYRILVNEALDSMKAQRRYLPLEPGHVEGLGGGSPASDENGRQEELEERIEAAILRLSPDYRQVIVLRHFANFSYREIADLIQVPEKTVKSRLFAARLKLREIFLRRGWVQA